jgi:hypothetical protein
MHLQGPHAVQRVISTHQRNGAVKIRSLASPSASTRLPAVRHAIPAGQHYWLPPDQFLGELNGTAAAQISVRWELALRSVLPPKYA